MMARFVEISYPYMAESYTHGWPYKRKEKSCEKLDLVRLLYDMLVKMHISMAQLDKILNPYMNESDIHGWPYHGTKESCEKLDI